MPEALASTLAPAAGLAAADATNNSEYRTATSGASLSCGRWHCLPPWHRATGRGARKPRHQARAHAHDGTDGVDGDDSDDGDDGEDGDDSGDDGDDSGDDGGDVAASGATEAAPGAAGSRGGSENRTRRGRRRAGC